jgi:hypothetical protein
MMTNAINQKGIVGDCMSAIVAAKEDTRLRNVERHEGALEHPRYVQRSVWTSVEDSSPFSPTALCTETDDTLPRPLLKSLRIEMLSQRLKLILIYSRLSHLST